MPGNRGASFACSRLTRSARRWARWLASRIAFDGRCFRLPATRTSLVCTLPRNAMPRSDLVAGVIARAGQSRLTRGQHNPRQDSAVSEQDSSVPGQDSAVPEQDSAVSEQDSAVPEQDL